MTKPQLKKPPISTKAKIILFIIGIVLASIVGSIIWVFVHNDSYYSYDKAKVEARARELLYAVDEPKGLIYSDFRDDGCKKSPYGVLGSYTACGYVGDRIYTLQDKSNLRALHNKLQSMGFQPANTTADELSERLDNPTDSFQMPYSSPGEGLVVRLVFADSDKAPDLHSSLGLPDSLKIDAGTLFYGLEVVSPYWSCSNFPCPNPPTTPHQD